MLVLYRLKSLAEADRTYLQTTVATYLSHDDFDR